MTASGSELLLVVVVWLVSVGRGVTCAWLYHTMPDDVSTMYDHMSRVHSTISSDPHTLFGSQWRKWSGTVSQIEVDLLFVLLQCIFLMKLRQI